MSRHILVQGLMAALAALALVYFAFVAWRAGSLADVLLERGWAQRGWTKPRATLLIRVIGGAGAVVSAAAVALALFKLAT